MGAQTTGVGPQAAAALAADALAWLLSEPDRLQHFLAATGQTPAALRAGLEAPETWAAVLDFVLMDDAWVLDCAAATGHDPQHFWPARQALPGGGAPNWT